MEHYDVVVIGAGHNGLIAAAYLARGGLKPLVIERRAYVGGAAITEEFHPGFRCPTLAHNTGPLHPIILNELQLASHGLRLVHPDPAVIALNPAGPPLPFYSDPTRTAEEITQFSRHDGHLYLQIRQALIDLARFFDPLLRQPPPPVDHLGAGDLWGMLGIAKNFRGLGEQNMFHLLRWPVMPVADLVNDWFETDLLRAVIAARGVFGTAMGPWSPGTGAVLLLRAAADPAPAGSTTFPEGSMGALSDALASAARQAGAEIRTGQTVRQIGVKSGAATRVILENGNEVACSAVVSGADPKRTLLQLVDPANLSPEFAGKIRHYRTPGTVAKVNIALSSLPWFAGLENANGTAAALAGRIHIAPSVEYLERAFDSSKYGDISPEPYLDVLIPSVSDPSLAPAGQHVMSVYVQFAPYQVKGDWSTRREELADIVVNTLSNYAPRLPQIVRHRQVITPRDLEQEYGFTGGQIFHGEPALDQLFSMRPLLGYANYHTPIRGLYLCGSGTHPGIGLTGLSGRNAAQVVLKDLRRRAKQA